MSHVHALSMHMYFFSHILTIVNCFGTFLIVSFSLPFFLFTLAAFCERPSIWGKRQFTPCRPFAKGTGFMNMVMTFVLHPLSHYNYITKPRARFLLSLLEHFTIDFPSHFILSIIDVHLDSVSRDKLIFPSAITKILHHFSVSFPFSDHFSCYVCHRLRYH